MAALISTDTLLCSANLHSCRTASLQNQTIPLTHSIPKLGQWNKKLLSLVNAVDVQIKIYINFTEMVDFLEL